MTETTEYVTVDAGIPVSVYPDEFKLLLKVINRAIDSDYLSPEELNQLIAFKDDFAETALEYGE